MFGSLCHVIRQVSKSGIVEAHGMCQHIMRKKCLILCVRPNSGSSKLQTEGEKLIIAKLKEKFPGAKDIEVSDISGGCGAMYQISIEAEEFKGKKTVMQHRLVNEVLAEEIRNMHGLQLNTKAPSS
ncbi:bolA-like protein 3 isoform X1 [Pomacea canaliculata]|uniref:bolA-like protein 3 isoform X1 n=2 Tax=Pomacea canaliculata TaxID=400727 RepID=UPI000D73096B|nr:bolA-like protein 3 isoform X1 [Pomacea canaliculata]